MMIKTNIYENFVHWFLLCRLSFTADNLIMSQRDIALVKALKK